MVGVVDSTKCKVYTMPMDTQMKPKEAQKESKQIEPQPQSKSQAPCLVKEQPDGGLQVTFLIEPESAARIKKRAYVMSLDRFIWENMLKQAIAGLAY